MGKVIYHFILVHNPKLILLERIPHCRQMKVAVALGKVHGVFYEQVYLANSADTIPIVEIDNTVWKKAFTGRGRAEKPEIKEHITRYYKQIKLQTPLYDESDAIAMGIAYLTGQVKERRE